MLLQKDIDIIIDIIIDAAAYAISPLRATLLPLRCHAAPRSVHEARLPRPAIYLLPYSVSSLPRPPAA